MSPFCLRVLVGTADPHLWRILSTALENEGHSVLRVANARDAFHRLLTEPLDVVLLDVLVGDITGMDVARAARKSARAERLETLLLAHDVPAATVSMADAGVHVLGKPLDVLALLDRLREGAQARTSAAGAGVAEVPARPLPPARRAPIPAQTQGSRASRCPSADKWTLLGIGEDAVADEVERAADTLIQSLTLNARLARSLDERTAVSETAARVRAARTELLRHLQETGAAATRPRAGE